MASIFDVNQNELIEKVAKELKKVPEMKAPEWAVFVKTGAHKERPPLDKDWWFMRTASILRKIHMKGPIGVSKLRTLYGGKKDRGMAPEKFVRASGNIIRKVLQQLEKSGFAKQEEKGNHKGRVITPKGRSLLDKVSTQIQKSSPKPKVEEKKPESKKGVEKKVEEVKSESKDSDNVKPKASQKEEKKPEEKKPEPKKVEENKVEVKKVEKLESETPNSRKEISRKPAEQKPQQEKNG